MGSYKSHRSQQDQLLSAMGPKIPAIHPSNMAVCAGSSYLPVTVFTEIQALREPRSNACKIFGPRRDRAEVTAWQLVTLDNFWVRCGSPVSPGQCSFGIGCSGRGFNTGKMVPLYSLLWRMALAPEPCNAVSPHMFLVPPEPQPFACTSVCPQVCFHG